MIVLATHQENPSMVFNLPGIVETPRKSLLASLEPGSFALRKTVRSAGKALFETVPGRENRPHLGSSDLRGEDAAPEFLGVAALQLETLRLALDLAGVGSVVNRVERGGIAIGFWFGRIIIDQ